MSLIAKNDWPEGIGIHASQTALRELGREMLMCDDEDQLDALWASYGPLLRLAWDHNEAWYISLKIEYRKRKQQLEKENSYGIDEQGHW